MGPVYLQRLLFLHHGRADALKRILASSSPRRTEKTLPSVGFNECLSRWDARPDLPNSAIESALSPLGNHVRCLLCREGLGLRVKIEWLESQWADIQGAYLL